MGRRRDSDDKERDLPMSMLPAHLRDGDEASVDMFIHEKMNGFDEAIMYSEARTGDPVRLWIAKECVRLAMDPRIPDKDVRARAGALLNATKALGLDRDIQRFDPNAYNVENALRKLREAATHGVEATGRVLHSGTSRASGEVRAGQSVLLCGTPVGGVGGVKVGPIRTTLSSTTENPDSD